jgi:hypothetical protein
MAKRSKALPARRSARSRDDDSVLIRTAESLGRMIGSLQRQLQDATSHMSDVGDTAFDALPELPQLDDVFGREKKKTAGRKSSSSSGAAKKTPRKSGQSRKTVATKESRQGARRGAARTATAGRSRKTSRKR